MGYTGRHRASGPPRTARRTPAIAGALLAVAVMVAMAASSSVPPSEPAAAAPPVAPPMPAPATTPAATPAPTTSAPRRAAACSPKGRWGAKPHVTRVGHHLAARFGVGASKISGYRAVAVDKQGHPAGLALDFTVGRSTGDRLAAYVLANQERLGVKYVIWRQRLNYGSGWKPMRDRGGATANHYDHVHVSFERTPSGIAITC